MCAPANAKHRYFQDNPNSLTPFTPNSAYSDPTFSECYTANCYKTFGLRIINSTYVFSYGAGHYAWFDNYDQGCLLTENCQQLMVSLEQSEAVYLYALCTKAAANMIEVDGVAIIPQEANMGFFLQTVGLFEFP